ncbi:hypothetical protein GCM10023176_58540 [Micromonospora coerulea]|uniref:Sortilin N-terminal domain-containing protein n=1 Tax=Micromonospora coerulea TaxID=47856 RepID=A0ABP8T3N8_9ACTN
MVWAGTEPSALFRSDDGGRSFTLVRALWDHPHRERWEAGFGGQAIHSVLPHPRDPARMAVARSTGGVYRTEDAGASWTPGNTGIRAYFLPDEWPEFGQCVHKIARAGPAARRGRRRGPTHRRRHRHPPRRPRRAGWDVAAAGPADPRRAGRAAPVRQRIRRRRGLPARRRSGDPGR